MDENNGTPEKSHSFIIKAVNVPKEFFENRDVAKKYFRRFGKVKLVMFKPKRRALLIEYANEDGMLNALEVAGEYNGHVFNVKRDTQTIVKKKKTKKEPDPDWIADPDVKAELEAMGAFGPTKTYDLRPEKMVVDAVELPQVAKNKQRKWKNVSPSPKIVKKKILGGKDVTVGPEQIDLINTIKQQALTTEEKFKVLDARDKLIRFKLKKTLEISKAKATVGTCPDMCPEKERLMREAQHQVALYEQEGGKGMNARLAVKQYSRSSADQEAPLPQELRPVGVLQMTMGYLMHRIMNMCDNPDVNIGEWYHFLWDRTRGIRKDITQQELCCQGSVELVEQCARFHIFCSARLVAEDLSVFDQKINTENLTKCLQTLKYMYHDLQLKGESCRNESEFRAYIILLNLNDGNFMWEVQQLKDDIQQSKEVKFALEVYSSLDKHNYVKFFKLVNSTTYLNACILMRYFIQVRVAAIKTLLKSYSPRVSQTSLPVSYLTKILAFESDATTTEFFETYGLYTDAERKRIRLDRPRFCEPEFPYVLDRAVNLVESKRQLSIGEVVCGKELPPRIYETHIPQNSFTEDGYLKSLEDIDEIDSVSRKEETKMSEQKEKNEEPPRVFTSPPVSRGSSPNIFAAKQSEHSANIFGQSMSDKKEESNKTPIVNIFGKSEEKTSTINIFSKPEISKMPTTSVFGKPEDDRSKSSMATIFAKSDEDTVKAPTTKSLWSTPAATKTNIFGNLTQNSIFTAPSNIDTTAPSGTIHEEKVVQPPLPVLDQKKIDEELKRRQREEEEKKRQLEEERKKAELEAKKRLQEQQRQLEEARRAAALRKRQMEEEQRRIEREKQKAIEIKLAVKDVMEDLINDVEENIKREKLNEISRKMYDRKLKDVVRIWKENTRRKRKRKAIDFSPLWFGPRTLKEEADELRIGSQDLALANIKRYKRGKPYEIPLNEANIGKIDLTELTYKFLVKRYMELDMKLHNELFWKVTISLPNELELSSGLNYIEKVLQNCIQWKEKNSTTVLIEQSKTVPTVTYCLEKQKGLVVNKNQTGTNGIIFIANDFNEYLYKRIINYLKNCGKFVKIPVVFALQKYNENDPNLTALIRDGIISEYLIIVDKFTSKNLVNIVEEALIFLSTKVEKSPPLEMDTLKSFLSKYLCSDLWKRANSFAKWNSNYKNCLKNPTTVIYLYNEAIDRLNKILLNDTCREHAKFPEIFKEFLRSEIPDALPCDYKYFPSFWDNPSYIRHLEKILNSLRLPNFLENWPPSDQLQLELSISKYCTQISKEAQATFYKMMSILLKNIDPSVNFKEISNVVWTDVIELLSLEKLNQTNFSLYGTGFVNKSIYNQLIVVYDVNILNDYARSDWFYINNPVIKQKILQFLQEEEQEEAVVVNEDEFEDIDIDAILEKVKQPRMLNVNQIKSELTDCKNILHDLEDSFAVHRRILEKSGTLLKSIIEKK